MSTKVCTVQQCFTMWPLTLAWRGERDTCETHAAPHCTVCTVKHITVQYCTVQYCTLHNFTLQYCTLQYCTLRYCTLHNCTVYSTALYWTALYTVVPFSALHCIQCSMSDIAWQYVPLRWTKKCISLNWTAFDDTVIHNLIWTCNAMQCSAIQRSIALKRRKYCYWKRWQGWR